MAVTLFTRWFEQNVDSFPQPADPDGSLLGLTLFNRCPNLMYDSPENLTGWRSVVELSDLVDSPHWQVPASFVDNVLVFQEQAATAEYYVLTGVAGGNNVVHLAEGSKFTMTTPLAPTANPIVAMAFWYAGTMAGKVNPVILMVQFDMPILLMADAENPATISAPIPFTWRA